MSAKNSLLSALSLALCHCMDLQSRKTVEGSAKSCSCFQDIQTDLCVYLPWHNRQPPKNPQNQTKNVFYYKDLCSFLFGPMDVIHCTFLNEITSMKISEYTCSLIFWLFYRTQLFLQQSLSRSMLCTISLVCDQLYTPRS